jgi:hypothetical protein
MAEPSDQELYNKTKREVDKNYDKPSAYRSMAYTRTYLKNYREKYGDDKKAYTGKNPEELKTWRKEKWVDVKSVLKDPKNPTACGNAPIKKGEYPLCMPEKQLAKYSKSELGLLVQRKNQIGKRRLVKDSFLRDVLEPEKITPIREYKDKYIKEPKNKLPEPLPKAQAEKILKEKPIKIEKEVKEKEPKQPRQPRQKREKTEEEIADDLEKKAITLEKRNERRRAAYVPVERKTRSDKKERVAKVPREPGEKRAYGPRKPKFDFSKVDRFPDTEDVMRNLSFD